MRMPATGTRFSGLVTADGPAPAVPKGELALLYPLQSTVHPCSCFVQPGDRSYVLSCAPRRSAGEEAHDSHGPKHSAIPRYATLHPRSLTSTGALTSLLARLRPLLARRQLFASALCCTHRCRQPKGHTVALLPCCKRYAYSPARHTRPAITRPRHTRARRRRAHRTAYPQPGHTTNARAAGAIRRAGRLEPT